MEHAPQENVARSSEQSDKHAHMLLWNSDVYHRIIELCVRHYGRRNGSHLKSDRHSTWTPWGHLVSVLGCIFAMDFSGVLPSWDCCHMFFLFLLLLLLMIMIFSYAYPQRFVMIIVPIGLIQITYIYILYVLICHHFQHTKHPKP